MRIRENTNLNIDNDNDEVEQSSSEPIKKDKKISRNSPCPCGDTIILASSNKIKLKNKINSINDKRINSLKISLYKVFSSLSEQIVRDGEGA